MQLQTAVDIVQDYSDYNTIGMTPEAVGNAVLREIWEMDVPVRLKNGGKWSPNVPTTAAKLTYTFVELGLTDARKVIGLFKPALSALATDYSRTRAGGSFDQRGMSSRVYDGEIFVDNERKTATFKNDPLTTTDVWQADYYVAAPTITLSQEIPLLDEGWAYSMFIPGMLSYFERGQRGQASSHRMEFLSEKQRYFHILQNNTELTQYDAAQGIVQRKVVRPL